jgi:uncharacterized RDD family membrane protein YckC
LPQSATTESLPPPFEAASLPRRLAAFCYDLLLIAALAFCFTLLVLAARLGAAVPPGSVWFPLSLAAIVTLFFCGFWVHGGQTVGMRAWRIRVVTDEGHGLTWPRAAARFGAALVALLPAGLGFWWSVIDADRRGWHDRWTRTRVIRAPTAASAGARTPRT